MGIQCKILSTGAVNTLESCLTLSESQLPFSEEPAHVWSFDPEITTLDTSD